MRKLNNTVQRHTGKRFNKAFNPKAKGDNPTNDGTVTEGNPTEDIHKTGNTSDNESL